MTPELEMLWGRLDSLKTQALVGLTHKGCIGNAQRHNDRNRLYFALEACEQLLVESWLQRMRNLLGEFQVLRLGDALWLPSTLPLIEIRRQFENAATALGLHKVQLRSCDMVKERQNLCERFPKNAEVWLIADRPSRRHTGVEGSSTEFQPVIGTR